MSKTSRRQFVQEGLTLAAAGGLLLPVNAGPTETSGTLGSYTLYLQQEQAPTGPQPRNWNLTEPNILGPFHRAGAPFRAKITPPLEPGTVLLISGRVYAHDTRRPLANAVLDIWQANAQGRYDNDDPQRQPAAGVFLNRARLVTDETGYYEFETIKPAPYRIGANTWRPSHIHYMVRHPGYRQLVTQLYFRGDEHQRTDDFIRESLIIALGERRNGQNTYKTGTFDIVLARGENTERRP